MATIVCIVGDKGGTGKSTWARGVADLYRLNGVRAALFDGDWLARSLFKFFCAVDGQGKALPLERQDPRRNCLPYDARDRRLGRDLLLNSMALPGADVMLHDLPAGFRSDIAVLMGAPNPQTAVRDFVAAAAGLGHQVVFVNVFTPSPSDFHTAPWLAQTLAGRADAARIIAVRNGLFDDDAFALWRNESAGAFAAAGGIEIDMPRLDAAAALLCDQRRLRFSAALKDESVALAERLRLTAWLRLFAQSLSSAAEILRLPPGSVFDSAPLLNNAATAGDRRADSPSSADLLTKQPEASLADLAAAADDNDDVEHEAPPGHNAAAAKARLLKITRSSARAST